MDTASETPAIEAATRPSETGDRYAVSSTETPLLQNSQPVDVAPPATEVTPTAPPAEVAQAPTQEAVPANTATFQIPGGKPRAAWLLGGKLGLAALANDRGIAPEDVPKWFGEAQELASELRVTLEPLPEQPATPVTSGASEAVLRYILTQEKLIGTELHNTLGAETAALFQLALRTDLLMVLNNPGSKGVDTVLKSIAVLGPRTGLPAELWQPLLDQLANGDDPAAVRAAVRQMHNDVSRYLAKVQE